MTKRFNSLLPLAICLISGCATAKPSGQLDKFERATLASEQSVTAKTTLMRPKLKTVTNNSFDILYMDASFKQGKGTPINVRNMATTQCQTSEQVALYLGSSQDSHRSYMITARYKCAAAEPVD